MAGFYGKSNNEPSSVDLLKQRIKEGQLNGVFLFWGAEEYTKDFFCEKIRKTVKDSPLPEFNYIVLDGEKQGTGELEDAILSVPYMWDRKVVEIRGLQPGKISASSGEEYARLFSDIPDYATVLIVMRADDYDGNVKTADTKKNEKDGNEKRNGFKILLKSVEENGLVVEFEAEKGDKLTSWVSKHFSAKGVKTDANFASALISYCGTDMYNLQGEIQKLCDCYQGVPLKEQDIFTYCCANESYVFFDIASCMNRRDVSGAKRILSGLKLNAETIPMAMGYLASNFQLMMLVRSGLDCGKSSAQIANEQKIPSWKVSKAAASLNGVMVDWLQYAIKEIAQTDELLKSRSGNAANILEFLIYRICAYGK